MDIERLVSRHLLFVFGLAFAGLLLLNGSRPATNLTFKAPGKPCERAAWCHSLIAAAARARKQCVASLFFDLKKFYEQVAHETLLGEGQRTGFNLHLLLCL